MIAAPKEDSCPNRQNNNIWTNLSKVSYALLMRSNLLTSAGTYMQALSKAESIFVFRAHFVSQTGLRHGLRLSTHSLQI